MRAGGATRYLIHSEGGGNEETRAARGWHQASAGVWR
jgi:hypothetical protein